MNGIPVFLMSYVTLSSKKLGQFRLSSIKEGSVGSLCIILILYENKSKVTMENIHLIKHFPK